MDEHSYDKLSEIGLPGWNKESEFARYRGNKQLWKGEQEIDKKESLFPFL